LALFALAAGSVLAVLDWNTINWWFPKGPFWSQRHWQYLWDQQWALFASYCLAGGLLSAALLIFRTLGYRLCREEAVASPRF
jgi:hypothetical protein